MDSANDLVKDLIAQARALHRREREITLESVRLVGQLMLRYCVHIQLNLTQAQFAPRIGLTPNRLWKRLQAARVLRYFPRANELLMAGELSLSTLSLLASKITYANADCLLDGIKGKAKRWAKSFIARVTPDGNVRDGEREIELCVTFSGNDAELLDRARALLTVNGKVPSNKEVLLAALKAFTGSETRTGSPIRSSPAKIEKGRFPGPTSDPAPDVTATPASSPATGWARIPATRRREIWLRDEGRCTFRLLSGELCEGRGIFDVETLTLRCREHHRALSDRAADRWTWRR